MKTGEVIVAIARSIVALAAGWLVFFLVFYNWLTVSEWALRIGGAGVSQPVNHLVMLTLGLSVGTVVILLCARGDLVTPILAALALFALALLGILIGLRDSNDITRSVTFGASAMLGYFFSVTTVLFARRRSARRQQREHTNPPS
jgi:hypothetical protein